MLRIHDNDIKYKVTLSFVMWNSGPHFGVGCIPPAITLPCNGARTPIVTAFMRSKRLTLPVRRARVPTSCSSSTSSKALCSGGRSKTIAATEKENAEPQRQQRAVRPSVRPIVNCTAYRSGAPEIIHINSAGDDRDDRTRAGVETLP